MARMEKFGESKGGMIGGDQLESSMNDTYAYHIGCIIKVLIYIEERFDQPILLEEMAKIACISPYYFHRLFRAYVGETVADYIKKLRVQRARERLQYSDDAITDIALDVGYETPSSFNKVFNQVMGQSPRQYRKIMQPIVRAIMERTDPSKNCLQPEYVNRKEEKVLFVRRIGDYKETPWQAFDALFAFIDKKGLRSKITGSYSFALDDPQIVGRDKCRFDACVALSDKVLPQGEVGQKILQGGRYAVFTHRGPCSALEKTFLDIFTYWYPTSNICWDDDNPFCEYIRLDDLTKIYIPLSE